MTEASTQRVRQLEHELLKARDEVIGLRAQLSLATARLDELSGTPLSSAMTRIDELESERQALYHHALTTSIEADEQVRAQAELFRASRTWRVGALVLSPLRVAHRVTGRR